MSSQDNASALADVAVPMVIGVTSHRDIPEDEGGILRESVRDFFARLQREYPFSPLWVLSPLAEGGDQLVAEEGLKLGARLVAPLPFARELYAQDFTDPAARERFESLCAQAQVIELPLLDGHTPDTVSIPGEARNRQYAQAGMFVARHCHLLLAIWDGKPFAGLGGTAQIVDYFLTGTPPGDMTHRRNPRLRLYGGGDERLLCHLVCSRDKQGGTPAAPLQPGQVVWRSSDGASVPDAPMPAALRTVFARMDGFNAEAAKYAGEIGARRGILDDCAIVARRPVPCRRLAGHPLPAARVAGNAGDLSGRVRDGRDVHGVRQLVYA